MEKFVVYVDYKSYYRKYGFKFEYVPLNAKSIIEAIAEADMMWNEKIYRIRIMKKFGKIGKEGDYKTQKYKAILCRRSYGWYPNTEEYYEHEHFVERYYNKDREYYEMLL